MTNDDSVQIELEEAFHKNQALPRLREFFLEMGDGAGAAYLEEQGIPAKIGIELMAQMVLHKRLTFGAMVGILADSVDRLGIVPKGSPWDVLYQATADLVVRCIEASVVNWEAMSGLLIVRYDDVGAELEADLRRYQYPLPMVVEPDKLTKNRDTGYLSRHVSHGSVILKKNHTDEDVCLDHLNRMNSIPLKLNLDTVRSVSNQWADISRQKDGETRDDYDKRVTAFHRYNEYAGEVIEMMAMTGNRFWITHRYDKRGRCYAQGYAINPQGNDWSKSIIEFSDEESMEPVT